APDARFQQTAIVIDERDGLVRIGLTGLARHPVPSFRREQRKPLVEFGLVEQPRLMDEELLAAVQGEPGCDRWRGARLTRDWTPRAVRGGSRRALRFPWHGPRARHVQVEPQRAPIFCLCMILSENRCPLFGIMR